MYQFAGFNFTYFYKGQSILVEPLKEALRMVLDEVPHFAGRGQVLNLGFHLKDSVIECSNKGVEFSAASTLSIRYPICPLIIADEGIISYAWCFVVQVGGCCSAHMVSFM